MHEWLKKHSGHQIKIEYVDKTKEVNEKIPKWDMFWCVCLDCDDKARFDFI